MQVPARVGPEEAVRPRVQPAAGRIERAARQHARHRVRRHPRAVLRPAGAVQAGRRGAGHQLHIHGRLCGQRSVDEFV